MTDDFSMTRPPRSSDRLFHWRAVWDQGSDTLIALGAGDLPTTGTVLDLRHLGLIAILVDVFPSHLHLQVADLLRVGDGNAPFTPEFESRRYWAKPRSPVSANACRSAASAWDGRTGRKRPPKEELQVAGQKDGGLPYTD
jgi:hypothetical protein